MNSSTIERESGGAKRLSTLKGTARKAAMVGVGVSMLGSGIAFSTVSAQAAEKQPEPQVTICHRTNSTINPYNKETVDESSIYEKTEDDDKGHGSHTGPLFDITGGKSQPAWGDIIPKFDDYDGLNLSEDGIAILRNDCNVPGASDASELLTVCIANLNGGSPYTAQQFRRDEVVNLNGTAKNPGPATTDAGVYPSSPYGNIVPAIDQSSYPTGKFSGVNNTSGEAGGLAILKASCNWNRTTPSPEPTPTVTVTTPGTNTNTTNTVTVPGPTVTVTASPSVTASAVPPVAIAPVVTPSAQPPVAVAPGALEPVAVAPVAAAVPTAVNAGDGSSQNKSMSPLGIVLMALAGIGVLYAALKLSTRRRSTSSH